jgi:F-type H+-transporting ATPase subunit b
MLKILFRTLTLLFVFQSMAQSSESGGMPQLNPEFWVSQIFWLTLTFGILFIVLSKFILPKISTNLETRKSQILENIDSAEKQRQESENKIKEYEKIILNSKNEAKNLFNEARKKVLSDINKKKETLENEINEEIKNAEKEIIDLKNNAPEKINKIAIETSKELVKKLIDAEVNNSSISAIVEDLSKRNKDKYYDA